MPRGEKLREGTRHIPKTAKTHLRSSFRETGAVRVSLVTMAKVHRAADLVRGNAVRHYEKHRDAQINKAYARLLLKSAPTLTLTPVGAVSDPKAQLMARALREVTHRHGQRLLRIEEVRKSMLKSGRLRVSRDLDWGSKVKESFAKEAGKEASSTRGMSREQRSLNAKIATAQDRARRKAEAHRVRHHEKWTSARYRKLTRQFDFNRMSASDGQHVREIAMEAASRSVSERHEARLQKIDEICNRMRESGAIRETRPTGRNLDLGR